jgi:undecaprenyl diphosphate synthase
MGINFAVQSEGRPGLHVAIIMDGNGRWAARRGRPRAAGHRAGIMAARRIVERADEIGIRCLTLYAFSSDNWQRPPSEVERIFWLLRAFLRLETARLRDRGTRLEAIGRRDRIPEAARIAIDLAEAATTAGRGLHLRVAIDYSSRDAITRAACEAVSRCGETFPRPEQLRPSLMRALAGDSGEVDLLIRAGGEHRLSDFLLWECAYAELVFTDRMWPDFGAKDLDRAVEEFGSRERRFGTVPASAAVGGAR